jgi:L-rhamnose mutarotase
LLKGAGIEEYSIFLDESTNMLFAYLRVADVVALDDLPQNEVMQRWWAYMKDIMETEDDNSPVEVPLKEVFYLP